MREKRLVIDDIPVRLCDPGARRGLLLLGHGGGQSKDSERPVALARRFAAETGLSVVCIDAVDHGERRPNAPGPGLPAGWHSTVMPRMVEDWRKTAAALGELGPPLAYVGFSMGMIFGAPTAAALPSVAAVVLGMGGIPAGGWIDDPALDDLLLEAALELGGRQVLMLNVTGDAFFPIAGVHRFFDAIPGDAKRLLFRAGRHDEWSPGAIDESIAFVNAHVHGEPVR